MKELIEPQKNQSTKQDCISRLTRENPSLSQIINNY